MSESMKFLLSMIGVAAIAVALIVTILALGVGVEKKEIAATAQSSEDDESYFAICPPHGKCLSFITSEWEWVYAAGGAGRIILWVDGYEIETTYNVYRISPPPEGISAKGEEAGLLIDGFVYSASQKPYNKAK